MATITTKETRAFNWASPGTLKVGDEIVETLKDRRNRIKVDEDGDASWSWERSPHGSSSNAFCGVTSSGNAGNYTAGITVGVCFGFYI